MARTKYLGEIHNFTTFALRLSQKAIPEFAPPFDDYFSFDGDILDYYRSFFQRYLEAIKGLEDLSTIQDTIPILINSINEAQGIKGTSIDTTFNLIRDVRNVSNMIIDAMANYLNGYPGYAFNKMEEILKQNNHLLRLLPQLTFKEVPLYRVRGNRNVNDTQYELKDLFHVPFHLRQECSSYRFSILGTPALYCAISLKTAVLETHVEKDKDVYAALFRFKEPEKEIFIDLALDSVGVTDQIDQYSLLTFYPLIMACSLKTKKPNSPFKPEYVIPQLFYQVIRQCFSYFSGIAYTSTQYENQDFTDFTQRNLVLFVRNCNQAKGYSKELANRLLDYGPVLFTYKSDTDLTETQTTLCHAPSKPIL